jgi:O-methyltransferase involved in polyketide biosynthesis
MEQQGPSRSAITTAVHRAAHLLIDDDPKIFADPFARAFAGYADDAEMLAALSAEFQELPRMRTVFAVRSRYAEDELAKSIASGGGPVYHSRSWPGFVCLSAARPYGVPRRLRS